MKKGNLLAIGALALNLAGFALNNMQSKHNREELKNELKEELKNEMKPAEENKKES